MKIEVIIKKPSGKEKRYLVHKLVFDGEKYTAKYTTIRDGFHISQEVQIDNVTAKIAIDGKIINTEEKA